MPPSYAWKFSLKKFFWNTKVFSNELFWNSETKTSTENRDTPSFIHKVFSPSRNFLKHWMVPWQSFFRSCEIKKLSTKPWTFPLLCLKRFDTRTLWKYRGALLTTLSVLWDKDFPAEFCDVPFLCIKLLRWTEFSETTKCSLTKLFGTVRQKILIEQSWFPFFCIEYRNQWWKWCL